MNNKSKTTKNKSNFLYFISIFFIDIFSTLILLCMLYIIGILVIFMILVTIVISFCIHFIRSVPFYLGRVANINRSSYGISEVKNNFDLPKPFCGYINDNESTELIRSAK